MRFSLFISFFTSFLSGCFISQEEIAARKTQFNGANIAEVTKIIGPPIEYDSTKAIWKYEETYKRKIPLQSFVNGTWITTGYRSEEISIDCTYTAQLENDYIQSSHYSGNSCARLYPKILS
ncbi:hypothetical protein F9L33_10155 [Amylibacter sp. SFDW26]|uniref:hypothetical protein n=1 Tax=Amylibacter sp. SFDW26 TaxID=2652722 RepID=UPI001261925E|nr:hypothetical protein [Amylibacter sp. SFDW26]KAB7613727.1 hypothetical protein F9L33_10155 [Amylibacter sp. SFDW26]